MRAPLNWLALAILAAAVAGCHKAQPAANITPIEPAATAPVPAPGLWIERVSDRNGAQVSRICLDAASAATFASMNVSLTGRCSRHDMAQAADGSWHFATTCDMGGAGRMATEGVIRGDFSSHYTVDASSQITGAAPGAASRPDRIVADIRRVGDCPAGMKPGDVVLPNGARVRLADVAHNA